MSGRLCASPRAPLLRPRGRKSERPVTRDVLDQLLATCAAGRPSDLRDRVLLLVAFASGGRRRSEAAALRVADLIEREPVPADPKAPDGPTLPALSLRLGRTKTASAEQDERVLLIGRPVEALRTWLDAGHPEGPRVPRDHPLGPARSRRA